MLMRDEIKAAIEALLFVSGERMSEDELLEILGLAPSDFRDIMKEMAAEYLQSNRGIQILTLDGGYIMGTKPEYAQVVGKLLKPVGRRLSPAALETLAIIAYRQPISRAEIEQIRGVKTDRVITTLLEKGIIKETGKRAGPGKPVIYGTTHEFLRIFGLSNLDELPELESKGGV
ncbi:MAG: SMC-Scp complex subunit ScpB [Syntrophomonadaceae bacterium]|nr:SMC-Scp complex subunit ScpB [Syntrophomonadaceae bacterium]